MRIRSLTSIRYPIVEIKRTYDRLISIIVFPIVVIRHPTYIILNWNPDKSSVIYFDAFDHDVIYIDYRYLYMYISFQ